MFDVGEIDPSVTKPSSGDSCDTTKMPGIRKALLSRINLKYYQRIIFTTYEHYS
jgi:hypothetical protein